MQARMITRKPLLLHPAPHQIRMITQKQVSNLEKDNSQSSIHKRFGDSSSDAQEFEVPSMSQLKPIKDLTRKGHLEYTPSHRTKMAATAAWS